MTKSEQAKYDTVVVQRNEALNTIAQQNGFISDLQARIAELEALSQAPEDAPSIPSAAESSSA